MIISDEVATLLPCGSWGGCPSAAGKVQAWTGGLSGAEPIMGHVAHVEGLLWRCKAGHRVCHPPSSGLNSTTHQSCSGWGGDLEVCIHVGPTPEGRSQNLWRWRCSKPPGSSKSHCFRAQLHCSPDGTVWINNFTLLNFISFICEVGVIIPTWGFLSSFPPKSVASELQSHPFPRDYEKVGLLLYGSQQPFGMVSVCPRA